MEEIDQARMARIHKAFDAVKGRFSARTLRPFKPLSTDLTSWTAGKLSLETSIDQAEQSRENELDRLLSTLVWTGDWLAEELIGEGKPKEGARVSLWVRNMAVVYAFSEVEESLTGLDRELEKIVELAARA